MDSQVLALRRNCITGTDIAAIIGISKWSSPLQVYLDKKGLLEPLIQNKYMEWGKRLELVIAEKYAADHKVELLAGKFFQVGIYGGTPDFYAAGKLLEIKTTSYRNAAEWGESGTDEIPEYYLTQVQWYLGLTNMHSAVVCVLIGGNDYREYEIQRNDRLISILRSKANDFWKNHVLSDIPPEASAGNDDKNLSVLFSDHNSDIAVAPHMSDHARRLAELKKKSNEIEDEISSIHAKLKSEIGNKSGLKGECWQATWKKSSDMKKINWEQVALEAKVSAELIEKYTKIVEGSRRFLFKSNFEGV